MLRRLAALPLIVVLLGVTALACWLPALHAAALRDLPTARAFFYSGAILMVGTAMLGMASASWRPRNARGHLAALAGAYLVLPIAMANQSNHIGMIKSG